MTLILMNLFVFYGLFALTVLTTVILLYFAYNMTYWKRRGVPYLKPNLLLGSLTDLLVTRIPAGMFFEKLYKDGAGHRFVGTWILQSPSLLIRDPILVKEILVKDYNNFCDRLSGGGVGETSTNSHDVIGKENIFMANNPEWKFLRNKFSPVFTGNKLKILFNLINDIGTTLHTHLQEKVNKGEDEILNLKGLWDRYSIDVIMSSAFGIKSNAISDENCPFRWFVQEGMKATVMRSFRMYVFFLIPQLIDPLRTKLYGNHTPLIRKLFWQSIEERRISGNKRGDIIDSILEIEKESKDGQQFDFTDDKLIGLAVGFFAAGFDTTSTTIAFSLFSLAMHPEIQERARAEAMEIKEKYGDFTYDNLSELKYIEMIIQEVLRLYPTLPIINRVCTKDYQIPDSDVVIEKGVSISIPMMGFHMDPEYFPDPEKFDPERFSEERKNDIKPFTYMPFGCGPKKCIGMRFGMMSTKLAISRFLTTFKVEPCSSTQYPLKYVPGSLLILPDKGFSIKISLLPA